MLRRTSIIIAAITVCAGAAVAGGMAASASSPTAQANPGGTINIVSVHTGTAGAPTQVLSSNWSGYAATTGRFTSVSSSWTQPAVSCNFGNQWSSYWVGLDGFNSGTVEQTGSEADCVGRTAHYFAWYEMFPAFPVNFSDPVAPGDQFNASVQFLGGDLFSLHIADSTQEWSHTVEAHLGTTPALSSAEVIVEAPCCFGGGALKPTAFNVLSLANFGTVSLTGATANGEPIGSEGFTPNEINMVGSIIPRTKATCSGLTEGTDFACTWVRSF